MNRDVVRGSKCGCAFEVSNLGKDAEYLFAAQC